VIILDALGDLDVSGRVIECVGWLVSKGGDSRGEK